MDKLSKKFSKMGVKKRKSPKKKSRKGIKVLTTTSKEPRWVRRRSGKRTWAQAAQEARNKKVKQKRLDKVRKRRSGNIKKLTKLFAKMDTKDKHKFNRRSRKRRRSPKKYRISKRRRSYNKKLLLVLATISAVNAKPLTLKEKEKFRKMIAKEFKDCETIPQKYRKLALKNHPDKGGNPLKMILLNEEKKKYEKKCKKKSTSLREGVLGTMAALGTLEYRRRRKTPKKTKNKRGLIRRRKKGKRGF